MIDADAAIDALGTIFEAVPEGAVFLAALWPNGAVRSLLSRDSDRIEKFLQRHDQSRAGLYFCVGTLRAGADGRSKDNVAWIAGLHADLDYKDHSLAPAKILQRIDQALLPASLIVETGGGLHCYWLFHEAEAATPGAVTRIEAALRQLAHHIGGDPQCAECSRLMRVPGTVNYKRETPAAIRVLRDRPAARYELAELEDWLSEAQPLLARRAKQGNGAATPDNNTDVPFAAYTQNASNPVDVEARLAAMRFRGDGNSSIHVTQVQVTAALLERGEEIDCVVARVLEATRAVGEPGWNWAKEERAIRRMCESWLRKHPREKGPSLNPRAVIAEELSPMHFVPIKYVVPGYIVEGLTLLAGKPKVGKSWLLLHAACAVASGGTTLDGVRCEEGDVLYAALEDSLRRLQSRMRKLFPLPPWPKRLLFVTEMARLTEGGLDYIKGWIEGTERPRLVIIDILAMVRMPNRRDLTAYDADYQAVKELRTLAHEKGVAIVLVHHLRKAEADDAYDTVSGTLGLTGAVDTVIIIRRSGEGTVLHARGRDLEAVERAVQFDAETCTWVVLGEAREVQQSDQRSAIVEALTEAGEPLGPNQIAAAAGMRATNVRKLLGKMRRDGTVTKATRGKYAIGR
jgi:hypothetical protein